MNLLLYVGGTVVAVLIFGYLLDRFSDPRKTDQWLNVAAFGRGPGDDRVPLYRREVAQFRDRIRAARTPSERTEAEEDLALFENRNKHIGKWVEAEDAQRLRGY